MPAGVLINHHASAQAAGRPASRLVPRGAPGGVRPAEASAAGAGWVWCGSVECHTLSERDTCMRVGPSSVHRGGVRSIVSAGRAPGSGDVAPRGWRRARTRASVLLHQPPGASTATTTTTARAWSDTVLLPCCSRANDACDRAVGDMDRSIGRPAGERAIIGRRC
jgi:hypothetical protein